MSSYKNLKDKIKELEVQLEAKIKDLQYVEGLLQYRLEYQREIEDELFDLKNMSWWSRLWNF